jgi:hypothetical protein
MAVGFFGKLLFKKGASKVSPTITKVTPNVPKTKGQKLKRDLKIATQKSKTARVKLDNTIFRIDQQKKKLEKMKTGPGSANPRRPGKMGGGFMGKRMGYKGGSKPDFLDFDKDGNTSESMKKALKDKKND